MDKLASNSRLSEYFVAVASVPAMQLVSHPLRVSSYKNAEEEEKEDRASDHLYDSFVERGVLKGAYPLHGVILPSTETVHSHRFGEDALKYSIIHGKVPDLSRVMIFDGIRRMKGYQKYVQLIGKDKDNGSYFVRLYKPEFFACFGLDNVLY